MSQQDMANLLGVPRAVVNMFERGERSLPVSALVKLADLEIAWNKHQPVSQEAEMCVNVSYPFFLNASIAGKLQQEVEKIKKNIEELKEQLIYIRTSYEFYQCWAKVLYSCRQEDNQQKDAVYEKWLDQYIPKIAGRIELFCPEKQFMLQYRIDSKMAALAVAEKALALLEDRG